MTNILIHGTAPAQTLVDLATLKNNKQQMSKKPGVALRTLATLKTYLLN